MYSPCIVPAVDYTTCNNELEHGLANELGLKLGHRLAKEPAQKKTNYKFKIAKELGLTIELDSHMGLQAKLPMESRTNLNSNCE